MPVIRIVLLVSVVGGLVVFAISNLSPVLPIVFLGMQSPALPLSAWIGIAIAAGALTSFFLQSLSYLQRGYSTRSFEEPIDVPSRTRSVRRERPQVDASEPQTPYTPPPPPSPETPINTAASDWEQESDEDWNFDEQSATSTANPQDFKRAASGDSYASRPSGTSQANRTNYEAPQEAKTGERSGSDYSYGYRDREQNESGVGKTDVVYDANYRVIAPPYQKATQPEDEDDWGFEDDEEFDDESGREPKRR